MHNNGIVNKKFLRIVDSDEYKEGEEIKLVYQMVVKHFTVILRVASAIDMQISEQFSKINT